MVRVKTPHTITYICLYRLKNTHFMDNILLNSSILDSIRPSRDQIFQTNVVVSAQYFSQNKIRFRQ